MVSYRNHPAIKNEKLFTLSKKISYLILQYDITPKYTTTLGGRAPLAPPRPHLDPPLRLEA